MLLRLACFALICVAARVPAQNRADRLGLTRDQVLAMGFDKWLDYYTAKRADNVASVVTACHTFAGALHERNVSRGEKLPAWPRLQQWYSAVSEYGDDMFRIQSRNGDGSWAALGAAQEVDMEELLGRLIALELKPGTTAPPDLAAAGKRVLAHHDVIAKKAHSLPVHPLTGIDRIRVESLNIRGQKVLTELLPGLLKTGGQEAYAVLVACSRLSDPAALFPPE